MNRTALACTAILSLAILGSALLLAGPLDPPPGAVGSTLKTLTEVEPRTAINSTNTPGDADSLFRITQPGSYYLTGNITGVAGKHGIEIAASGVTLDLAGFDLLGVPGSLDGVSATVGVNGVIVRDGSIRSWGDEGLDFTFGGSVAVADVSVQLCAGFGIALATNSAATRCQVSSNVAGGIATGSNCVVTECLAHGNGGGGILAFNNCLVVNCAAMINTGNGISAANGSTITGCSSTDNSASGFSLASGCIISECSASSNDLHGFNAADDCTITRCAARSNVGNGFTAVDGCAITECTASNNAGSGIVVRFRSTVANCNTTRNTLDGILCSAYCYVRNNDCSQDGNGGIGASIRCTGNSNRIEANNCMFADRVIDVGSFGNIIIRNTGGSLSTPIWTIVAGNAYGPIVSTPSGAAVNGASAAAALGSTDPNANFSY